MPSPQPDDTARSVRKHTDILVGTVEYAYWSARLGEDPFGNLIIINKI
jgi:hypothetical protein